MKKPFLGILIAAVTLLLAVTACNKESNNGSSGADNGYDRKAMLTHLADNLIMPAYSNFGSKMDLLQTSAEAFVTTPDLSHLLDLRAQWRDAYIAWQKVELYDFGPSVNNRNFFNIYPTDVSLMESYVSAGTYNLDLLLNNKVQGFPALDYLINGLAGDDAGIIIKYTTDAQATNRKKYMTDLVVKMKSKIDPVIAAWKGDYRGQFIGNDGSGAGSSLSLMTNEYIMYFERFLRSGKYAIPAGAMTGTALPDNVECYYSKNNGTPMAIAALQACQDFYLGKDFNTGAEGPGLNSYLKALAATNAANAELAAKIDVQFTGIRGKASGLGLSVFDAILTNRAGVLGLYDDMQAQVRSLKVDMTSAIGISITYTDNDGD